MHKFSANQVKAVLDEQTEILSRTKHYQIQSPLQLFTLSQVAKMKAEESEVINYLVDLITRSAGISNYPGKVMTITPQQ